MTSAALNTVYNQYLTTYIPKRSSVYDTHKKSELRNVYNSMVKLNKESPLFLFHTGRQMQDFLIGIKEESRSLRNTIASMGGLNEDTILHQKVAGSSNENIASASFIGTDSHSGEFSSFELEVQHLASAQENMGLFLPSSQKVSLPADTYSFDINVRDLNYEFQFNISENDTNSDLQNRLSRLIDNADIGLHASVVEDGLGNSSLTVRSANTGTEKEGSALFRVTDNKTSKRGGSVSYLGIQEITTPASNAAFRVNGTDQTAMSNHFTIEKMYELSLNGTSSQSDAPVIISLKNDVDSMTDHISKLLGSYNDFLKSVSSFLDTQPGSSRLAGEMKGISSSYQSEVNSYGIEMTRDGKLTMDEKLLRQSLLNEDPTDLFTSTKNFASAMVRKTDQISLNPMSYVEKTIVAYKNPGKNFASPYASSIYSGMMFNLLC